MPLPIIPLDLPPAIEHHTMADQAVVAAVSSSPSHPSLTLHHTTPPEEWLAPTGLDPVVPVVPATHTQQPTPWVDQAVPTDLHRFPLGEASTDAETVILPMQGPTTDPSIERPAPPGPTPEPLHPDGTEVIEPGSTLRVLADQQTFDLQRQFITAEGDVLLQWRNTQLAADTLWVNLNNRYLRAEGDVLLNRNQQILEGDTATYNLLQGSGRLTNGRGSLQLSTLESDVAPIFAPVFPSDLASDEVTMDDRLGIQGTISQVTSPGGVSLSPSSVSPIFGAERAEVGQLRFEASEISFDADGWYGQDIRLTNDPFSPPELELRGDRVSFMTRSEEEDELCIDYPRLVFDQGFSLPLIRRCYPFQRGQLVTNALNPLPTNIGYDNRDRDGFFIERAFPAAQVGNVEVTVIPQIYLSRWLSETSGSLFDPANVGLVAQARGNLGPRTYATGRVSLTGFDLRSFSDRLRASLRIQRRLGSHRLGVEYTYRDRLFNGSLGFQTVQTSAGLLLESPSIALGNTGITLNYQLSSQYVTANTDRAALLDPGVSVGLASLFRFQGAVNLTRSVLLWQGQALPSTASTGLRYSPRPIVPYLSLVTGLRGVATYYTSNNLQEALSARVGLSGQLGHLERDIFDYTQFNLGFSTQFIGEDSSPFLFDRLVDQTTLSGGIVQHIYGPILLGFQTSFNLNTGEKIDHSFSLEYRRRTYALVARYSPTRETGFLGFRLSQFNWTGRPDPFDSQVTTPNENMQIP